MNDCVSVSSNSNVNGFRPVNSPTWNGTTRTNKPGQAFVSKNSIGTSADTTSQNRCSVRFQGDPMPAANQGNGVGRRDQFMPFTFPATHTALWDHEEKGPSTMIHLIHDRCPLIVLEEKTLRLIQCFTRDALASTDECVCHLSASVCSESDGSSISVKIDRLATNGHSSQPRDLCPGDIQISCRVSKDGLKSTGSAADYLRSLELISSCCRDSASIDVSHFLSLRADCSYRSNASSHGVIFQIDFDLVAPATSFRMTPINPLALIPTALSKNLSGPLSISEVQGEPKSGYITMDQTRKILLVLESDPKVKSLPIVGIWTCGIANVNDAFVWASCARYVYSTHITERVCLPPDPFLVVIFSPLHSEPEFYESTVVNQGGRGGVSGGHNPLDFTLSSCHDVIHLNQENVGRTDSPIEMDLLPVASGGAKLDAFHTALGDYRSRVREADAKVSSVVGGTTEEIVPRTFPVPHCSAMSGILPSVPEVSLLFDGQNGGYPSDSQALVSGRGLNYPSPSATNGGSSGPYTNTAVNSYSPHANNASNPGTLYNSGAICSQNLAINSTSYSRSALANNYPQPRNQPRTNEGMIYKQNIANSNVVYSQPGFGTQTNHTAASAQNQYSSAPYTPAYDDIAPRPQGMAQIMNTYRPSNGYNNNPQSLPPGQRNAQLPMTNFVNQTSAPQHFSQAPNTQRYPGNGDMYRGGVRPDGNHIQTNTDTRQQQGILNQYQNGGRYPVGSRHTSTVPQVQTFSCESQDARCNNPQSYAPQNYVLRGNARHSHPLPNGGQQPFAQRNVGPGQMRSNSEQFARPPPRQNLENGTMRISSNQNVGPAISMNQNQNWEYGPVSSQTGPSQRVTSSPANQMPPRQAFVQMTQSPHDQFAAQRQATQSPQNQFAVQPSNNLPVFPRAPSSVSPARHQFSIPVSGTQHVQSPQAGVSESADSGFQNDSTNFADGVGGQVIPQEVYRRLSMQDAELRSLRLQLQELMTRQTVDPAERRVNNSEVTDDDQTRVKGQQVDQAIRNSNASDSVESCSIAINTSFYWPPESTNRTPVTRGAVSNTASPTVSSNNNSSDRLALSKTAEVKNSKQIRRSDGCLSEGRASSSRHITSGKTQARIVKGESRPDGNSGGRIMNRSVDGCGSCGGTDSASLTEIHVTDDVGGDRSGAESNVSEMIMDMPGYTSLSPDRIEEGGNDDMASDRSPMLGESVSMYEEEGYVAKMPCYDEVESERGAGSQTNETDDENEGENETSDDIQLPIGGHAQLNYRDMITNINKLLNNQDSSNQTDASQYVTPKLKSQHDVRDRHLLKNRHRAIDLPTTSSYVGEERERDEEPSLIVCDIVERTKDQLRRMGVDMDGVERAEKTSSTRFNEDTSYYLDPSMLPKVNYVSMLLDQSDADQSYDADALAMKYLRDDQLTELARSRQTRSGEPATHRYAERKDAGLDRVVSGGNHRGSRRSDVSVYGLPVGNMSYASRQYLVKFGLLDGGGEGGGEAELTKPRRSAAGKEWKNNQPRDQFENGHCDDGTRDCSGNSPIGHSPIERMSEQTSERYDLSSYSDTVCDHASPRTTLRHCHSDGDSFQSSLHGVHDEHDLNNHNGHKRRSVDLLQNNSSDNRKPPPRHSLEGFSSTPNYRRNNNPGMPRTAARFTHSDGSSVPVTPVFDTPRNMLPAADRTLEYPDDVIVDHNGTDPMSNDGGYVGRRNGGRGAPVRFEEVGGEEAAGDTVNSRRGERSIGNRVLDLERLMDMPKLV